VAGEHEGGPGGLAAANRPQVGHASDGDCLADAREAGDTDPTTLPVDTDMDGTPDYLTYLNTQLSQGVTPENNAALQSNLLLHAIRVPASRRAPGL
jgi:hypothetical protein